METYDPRGCKGPESEVGEKRRQIRVKASFTKSQDCLCDGGKILS